MVAAPKDRRGGGGGGGGGGGVHSIGGGGVVKGVVVVSVVGESVTMTVTPGPAHALSLWRRVCGATSLWAMTLARRCTPAVSGIISVSRGMPM